MARISEQGDATVYRFLNLQKARVVDKFARAMPVFGPGHHLAAILQHHPVNERSAICVLAAAQRFYPVFSSTRSCYFVISVCVICIVIGANYFKSQGVDTSIANDPNYPFTGGIR
ncbi:hypothetical protein P3T18_000156 [Paraburkholderia sp. GAS199]|uniref:hypothetical protein n=1 Tax=Paraburkholderia sp. GAS199 TaxID=3035126 RepID=UPI003D21683F